MRNIQQSLNKRRHTNHSFWCLWCREDVPHDRSHLRAWWSGFLLPRCLPASSSLASAKNALRKSTPNKSPVLGICPGTFHCVPNGALGVGIGPWYCYEGVIVGHEKWACVPCLWLLNVSIFFIHVEISWLSWIFCSFWHFLLSTPLLSWRMVDFEALNFYLSLSGFRRSWFFYYFSFIK